MATIIVTYLILGLPPRRIRLELPANTPGRFIAANAPKRAFAYLRSDEGNATTHYIDDTRLMARFFQRRQLKEMTALAFSATNEVARRYRR